MVTTLANLLLSALLSRLLLWLACYCLFCTQRKAALYRPVYSWLLDWSGYTRYNIFHNISCYSNTVQVMQSLWYTTLISDLVFWVLVMHWFNIWYRICGTWDALFWYVGLLVIHFFKMWLVKDDLQLKTTFDDGCLLIKDDFWWMTTFDGRWLSIEEDLRWKTTFNGRQAAMILVIHYFDIVYSICGTCDILL